MDDISADVAIRIDKKLLDESSPELLGLLTVGGLPGRVKKDFQLGIVFGADRVSHGSQYEDNGKLWGAVALGFSFAN